LNNLYIYIKRKFKKRYSSCSA